MPSIVKVQYPLRNKPSLVSDNGIDKNTENIQSSRSSKKVAALFVTASIAIVGLIILGMHTLEGSSCLSAKNNCPDLNDFIKKQVCDNSNQYFLCYCKEIRSGFLSKYIEYDWCFSNSCDSIKKEIHSTISEINNLSLGKTGHEAGTVLTKANKLIKSLSFKGAVQCGQYRKYYK